MGSNIAESRLLSAACSVSASMCQSSLQFIVFSGPTLRHTIARNANIFSLPFFTRVDYQITTYRILTWPITKHLLNHGHIIWSSRCQIFHGLVPMALCKRILLALSSNSTRRCFGYGVYLTSGSVGHGNDRDKLLQKFIHFIIGTTSTL